MTNFYHNWDPEEPGSRFTKRVEFVIGVGDYEYLYGDEMSGSYDEQRQAAYDRYAAETLIEIGAPVESVPIRPFDTDVGRGASADALGLVIDLLEAPGGIAATALLVRQIWNRLRKKGKHPTVSYGAAEQLCLADLHEQNPTLSLDTVRTILVAEATPPGPPSELGHTGHDLFTVIFQNADNSRSWAYLIHSDGKILHYSEGLPVPRYTLWWGGGE